MTCDRCGEVLTVGSWPFCPHGQGVSAVERDEIPGGQWFENGFETPRKFYSHSAHRAALAADGKEIRAKWAGPNDRYLINWGAGIDAQTLENAAVLVSRGTQAREDRRRTVAQLQADFPITVTPISELGR